MLDMIGKTGGRFTRQDLERAFGWAMVRIAEDSGLIRFDNHARAWRTVWS